MRTSYAITWEHEGAGVRSGRLELGPRALAFEGSNGNGSAAEVVPYEELTDVRIARSPEERLCGRQTLVLERSTGDPIRIASIVHPGIISELAERLASLHLAEEKPMSRVVVVLPLREGVRARVAELLRHGPPFDPEEIGLGRHHVFLTEQEAIFLFEADAPDVADRLLSTTSLWGAAAAWKELVAGPPRLAEDVYSWVQPHLDDNLSFAPTPGPGDSEGGDLF